MENQNLEKKELTLAEKFESKNGKVSDPKFDFSTLNGVTKEDYQAAVAKAAGKKIYHIHVGVDEDEKYDFLAIRPSKDLMKAVAVSTKKGDTDKANDLLVNGSVVAGPISMLEDFAVFASVLSMVADIAGANANFTNKA